MPFSLRLLLSLVGAIAFWFSQAAIAYAFVSSHKIKTNYYQGKITQMRNFDNFNRKQSQSSFQRQISTLNLTSANLKHPHLLRVNTNGNQIIGQVRINGNVVLDLNQNKEINLANYLSPGKNTVEISGRYSPSNALITVEFLGVGNTFTQQSRGSGILSHELVIYVK